MCVSGRHLIVDDPRRILDKEVCIRRVVHDLTVLLPSLQRLLLVVIRKDPAGGVDSFDCAGLGLDVCLGALELAGVRGRAVAGVEAPLEVAVECDDPCSEGCTDSVRGAAGSKGATDKGAGDRRGVVERVMGVGMFLLGIGHTHSQ